MHTYISPVFVVAVFGAAVAGAYGTFKTHGGINILIPRQRERAGILTVFARLVGQRVAAVIKGESVVAVVDIGIQHGQITTIHDPTNTNVIVDAPHKDFRRARSAMTSLMPTTTGSAKAIGLIYPELKGKLNGHAVRAPVLNASLTDAVFELARPTSAKEVNALFAEAANNELAGILGYEERPLVSADYVNDTRSAIIDAASTLVTDGTMLKVYAWYDNEMGYACRMVDLAKRMVDLNQ